MNSPNTLPFSRALWMPVVIASLVLGTALPALAQSRTEEAKKRLDGEASSTEISLLLSVLEISMEFMPEFFYFRPLSINELPLRYASHPYATNPYGELLHGIRDFSGETTKSSLFQASLHTAMPQGAWAMGQYAADVKWNIRAWGVQTRYEYLREALAPYGIHQYNLDVERKFRFFRNGDAGFFVGMRSIWLGGDTYTGIQAGSNFELYPVKPFSVRFTTSAAAMRYGSVTNQELGVGIHRDHIRFGLSHRWLNILGVPFRTISAGIGVYF